MALRGLVGDGMGGGKALAPSMECRMTFEGRLREEKNQLEERLKNVNAVLESLEKSPQILEVLEGLSKLGY